MDENRKRMVLGLWGGRLTVAFYRSTVTWNGHPVPQFYHTYFATPSSVRRLAQFLLNLWSAVPDSEVEELSAIMLSLEHIVRVAATHYGMDLAPMVREHGRPKTIGQLIQRS